MPRVTRANTSIAASVSTRVSPLSSDLVPIIRLTA
jgi:hypothetical protein